MTTADINHIRVVNDISSLSEDGKEVAKRRRLQASAFKQAVLKEVRALRNDIENRGQDLRTDNPLLSSEDGQKKDGVMFVQTISPPALAVESAETSSTQNALKKQEFQAKPEIQQPPLLASQQLQQQHIQCIQQQQHQKQLEQQQLLQRPQHQQLFHQQQQTLNNSIATPLVRSVSEPVPPHQLQRSSSGSIPPGADIFAAGSGNLLLGSSLNPNAALVNQHALGRVVAPSSSGHPHTAPLTGGAQVLTGISSLYASVPTKTERGQPTLLPPRSSLEAFSQVSSFPPPLSLLSHGAGTTVPSSSSRKASNGKPSNLPHSTWCKAESVGIKIDGSLSSSKYAQLGKASGKEGKTPGQLLTALSTPKAKEPRVLLLKDLADESFSNILKRRELAVSKLSALEKRNMLTLNPILSQLPKLKSNWDFLLDEMQWMAIDFRQERRWKLAYSQAISNACTESPLLSMHIERVTEDGNFRAAGIAKAAAVARCVEAWTRGVENFPSIMPALQKLLEICEHTRYENANTDPSPRSLDSVDMEAVDKKAKSALSLSLHTITTSLPNFVVEDCLQQHQSAAVKAIFTLNISGLGALLFGKSWAGKTYMAACVVKEWLEKASPQPELVNPRQVLVVVTRRSLVKWRSELTRLCGGAKIYIWHNNDTNDTFLSADVVLCVLEPLIASLTPPTIEKFTKNWLGLIVDVRGLSSDLLRMQVNAVSLGKFTGKLINISHWLAVLDTFVSSGDLQRLLISEVNLLPVLDDAGLSSDGTSGQDRVLVVGLLSFVAPGVVGPYAEQWIEWTDEGNRRIDMISTSHRPHELLSRANILLSTSQHPILGDKATEALETDKQKKQQDFTPSTVIWPVAVSSSRAVVTERSSSPSTQGTAAGRASESGESSQEGKKSPFVVPGVAIVEEYVSLEMDVVQLRKYMAVLEALVLQSALVGDNSSLLAKATVLLRRVCFHEGLVYASKAHEALPESQLETKAEDSEAKMPEDVNTLLNAQAGAVGATSTEQPVSTNDDNNVNNVPMPADAAETCTADSSAEENWVRRPLNPQTNFFPGFGRQSILSSPDFILSRKKSRELGSCKLRALIDILKIYKNKRIVVMTETRDEQLLVHQHLNEQNVSHVFAGLPGSTAVDEAFSWVICQNSIDTFNNSDTAQILVVTSAVFRAGSGSVLPRTANVILILSENWALGVDVRRCLQLGRLIPQIEPYDNAKKSEDDKIKFELRARTLNIVRVFARGTLEEALVRSGSSFALLQGRKLNDLHPSQFFALFQPQGLDDIENDLTGKGITAALGVLNLAPPLTKAYRLKRERAGTPLLSGSPVEDTKPRVGIGKGKGKGLMIQGPKGGVVIAPSIFSALPFASTTRESSEPSPDELQAEKWLSALEAEMLRAEFVFSGMHLTSYKGMHQFWTNDPIPDVYVDCEYSITNDKTADCSSEIYLSVFDDKQRPLALKLGRIRRLDKFYSERKVVFVGGPSAPQRLDIKAFALNGIGVSPAERNVLCLYQKKLESQEAIGDVCPSNVKSVAASSLQGTRFIHAFRKSVHHLKRSGDIVDNFLYLHPLQNATSSDVLMVPASQLSHSLDSQFLLKYMSRSQSKTAKRSKPQQKSDFRKKMLEHPIGVDLSSLPIDRQRADLASSSALSANTAHCPYGPKPLAILSRRPLKFLRESDSTQEPWTKAEDEYILEQSGKFGTSSWWLLERALICRFGDSSRVRSARQIKDRHVVLTTPSGPTAYTEANRAAASTQSDEVSLPETTILTSEVNRVTCNSISIILKLTEGDSEKVQTKILGSTESLDSFDTESILMQISDESEAPFQSVVEVTATSLKERPVDMLGVVKRKCNSDLQFESPLAISKKIKISEHAGIATNTTAVVDDSVDAVVNTVDYSVDAAANSAIADEAAITVDAVTTTDVDAVATTVIDPSIQGKDVDPQGV